MKKATLSAVSGLLLAGLFLIYESALLVRLEKDGFTGGELEIAGTKFDESPGSGTEYRLVFVKAESSAKVSCESSDRRTTSSDGYFSPWLQWYVSFHLAGCSIREFRPII